MKVKDIFRLMNSTVLHEWLHAKELKKICGDQNVFIIQGLGEKERGKKLKEEYFINSSEYESTTIDVFSFYRRIDRKNMKFGRADVNDRSVLSEEGVIKALRKPFTVGISISIITLLIYLASTCYFVYNGKYMELFFVGVIEFYSLVVGMLCAISCFGGTNSDYIRWKKPNKYIEQLDEDLIDKIIKNIFDEKQFKRGHIILNERFYNENIIGKEKIVCERFECNTMSVLINGKFEFIHKTQISKLPSIKENGLRLSEDSESENDTLGRGIYCYDYNEYLKGKNRTTKFDTTVPIRGIYEGKYLKCIYGDAASSLNESLREYLLLDNVMEIEFLY